MDSRRHFDQISQDYDHWKKKNWYYYQHLKQLYQSLIPAGHKVWEIGCGTGDILISLKPSYGLGTDTSEKMIEIARNKYSHIPNVEFGVTDVADISPSHDYDYVVMADVLEHIEKLDLFFDQLNKVVKPKVKIVVSVANPFWEPLLMLAEKLKMKMPEGPHKRLLVKENETIFLKNSFKIINKGYRLLVPKKIYGSDRINSTFYKNNILAKFGFITFWILEKD